MPSKRVLMLTPQPYFRARGTPFSVLHRVRALCEMGYQVDMVTYPFGEDITFDGLNIFRSGNWGFIKDVKIGPSLQKIFLDVSLFITTRKLLKKNKYDVIHSHEEAAFFAMRLAKKYKTLHVYDMHSSLPQQLENFNAFNLGFFKSIFEYLEKKVLTSCDATITICPELADLVESFGLGTPHELIENTADDSKVFSNNDANIREQYALQDKKIVLYTGTFESYQGIDILFHAFKATLSVNPEAYLIMVGGRKEQIEKYEQLAKTLGVENSVLFSGTVHPSEIPSYIKAADMIVSPRCTGTNTPLKIYGYLRTGKPIIATDMLTHTQVLNDEVAILVSPNELGISKGMNELMRNSALGDAKVVAAKKLAEEKYSDAIYMHKVNKLYAAIDFNKYS